MVLFQITLNASGNGNSRRKEKGVGPRRNIERLPPGVDVGVVSSSNITGGVPILFLIQLCSLQLGKVITFPLSD